MSKDDDDQKKLDSAIQKKASVAALKEVRKLTQADSVDRASNRRIAIYGFIALGVLLLLGARPWVYFIDDSDVPAFSFEARVVELYQQRNADENAWPPKIVGVESDKHGLMDVGVEIELYPELQPGDRVAIGFFESYLPLKVRVLERLESSSP